MDHQWFVGLSQVVLEVKCFRNYTIPDRSQGKEPSGPEGDFFLAVWMVSRGKKKKPVRPLARESSLILGGKLLTGEFWTLFYILSGYSSQKVLGHCKGRQNRAVDDAEQHDQIAAESSESQVSFIHLTYQGDFKQLNLLT